ncbi:MAG: hypothetical protein XD90_1620 [Methanobacterium sp. 42_16]|nr:MAG: hypothetical protein XD90_1620 [Methanobacterium sp. 42_16]
MIQKGIYKKPKLITHGNVDDITLGTAPGGLEEPGGKQPSGGPV